MRKGPTADLSRRAFIGRLGVGAGVAGLAVGCGDSTPGTGIVVSAADLNLMNFALNLEYLEAEFYLRAVTGQGLTSADAGSPAGAVTGGAQVPFVTTALMQYATEIANDELEHVRLLRSTLGSAAVARPAIDLTNSFNTLASMAGIGATFNPFASEDNFLVGAFVFEDLCVTAFHGLVNSYASRNLAVTTAGVMGADAYHAGELRTLIPALTGPYLTYANQITTLRGTLGGGNETPASASVAETNNCTAFERTTDQVLHVVYLAGAGVVSKGGFFPSGMNGSIAATAS
jgi:hypothetical protein